MNIFQNLRDKRKRQTLDRLQGENFRLVSVFATSDYSDRNQILLDMLKNEYAIADMLRAAR